MPYLEVIAKAPGLLERGAKHFVPSNVRVGDGTSSKAHGLFEVLTDG